jgi:unsaturated rhamnogalacturonyl hydrolase
MTLVDTLDVLPNGYRGRNQLIHIVRDLVKDLAATQDAQTGLRYQIIDQGNLPGNWTVTSSSRCLLMSSILP